MAGAVELGPGLVEPLGRPRAVSTRGDRRRVGRRSKIEARRKLLPVAVGALGQRVERRDREREAAADAVQRPGLGLGDLLAGVGGCPPARMECLRWSARACLTRLVAMLTSCAATSSFANVRLDGNCGSPRDRVRRGARRIESPPHAPRLGHDLDRRPARAGLRPALRPLDPARVHRPLPRPTTASRGVEPVGVGAAARFRLARRRRLDRHGDRGRRAARTWSASTAAAGAATGSRRSPSGSSPRARRRSGCEVTRDLLDRARDRLRQAPRVCARRAGACAATGSGRCERLRELAEAGGRSSGSRSRGADRLPVVQPLAALRPICFRPPCVSAPSLAVLLAVLAALAPRGRARAVRRRRRRRPRSVEGEPIELGELAYNVQITRFLNPDDTEDSEYLRRPAAAAARARSYLGVFLVIENETEEARPSATDYVVIDTLEQRVRARSRARARTRSRSAPRSRPRASCRSRTRPPPPGRTRARC